MSNNYGYLIRRNPATGRWGIYWNGKKQEPDFATEAGAEEWIDDQIPLNR
jgi:hypothetical protein